MNRRLISALVILAVMILVLIFNRGSTDVDLPLVSASIKGMKSIIFLVFMGVGVVIGLLLK